MQATRLDIPVQALEQFAQASALDASILEDLRSAVVELHDRMQYRTNVLGNTATSLNAGYNQLWEHLQRAQQSVDAHTSVLQNLIAENQGLRNEIAEARAHLAEAREETRQASLGPVQWQAQIEAHIAKIQAELEVKFRSKLYINQKHEATSVATSECLQGFERAMKDMMESCNRVSDENDGPATRSPCPGLKSSKQE